MKHFTRAAFHFMAAIVFLLGTCSISNAQISFWHSVPGSSINNPNIGQAGYRPVSYLNGNVYVPYMDQNNKVILSVYNGSGWQRDTVPANFLNGHYTPYYPTSVCVANNGTVYMAAGWDSLGFAVVMSWNGLNWNQLGGDAPNGLMANADVTSLCMDSMQNLYATGYFHDFYGTYLALWDGNAWIKTGNFTLDSVMVFYYPPRIVCRGKYVYVNGEAQSPVPPFSGGVADCIYRWDGTTWTNYTGWWYDEFSCFTVSNTGVLYVADNTFNRVFSYNGTQRTALGFSYINMGTMYDLQIDSNNYLYAATLDNTAGHLNDPMFIWQWTGTNWAQNKWSEMGVNNLSLHANNLIMSVTPANSGTVYATGFFTDNTNSAYLAVCNTIPANALFTYLIPGASNCGNTGEITSAVYQGTPPYTYAWSNGATTAHIDSLTNGHYYLTVTDNAGHVATGDVVLAGTCQTVITGHIFNDSANTCLYNGAGQGIPGVMLSLQRGAQTLYANTDSAGAYFFAVSDTGVYTISASKINACNSITLCGNPNQTITVSTLGDTLRNNNFGVYTLSGFDLTLHPGWTPASPGFEKEYWVMPFNLSPNAVNGPVTIIFNYDVALTFVSAPAPLPVVDTVAHTLTWTISGASVPYPTYDWNNERFICYFQVPGSLGLNYQLKSSFEILPFAGDCDTSDNYLTYSDPVWGSHDPNNKTVSPAGNLSPADSVLTYTINFQNNGTDSTHFITVTDSLSNWLDPTSVRNLASSAPYTSFTVSGNGLLTWLFMPCSLVDSATNPAGSTGFITFSVKKKSNTPSGTNISNAAYIYFDYNAAIITDTVSDSVINVAYTNITAAICTGDTLKVDTFNYTSTGTWSDTLITAGGYDSIIHINLTVGSAIQTLQSATICYGDSGLFNGKWYSASGTYYDSLTSTGGCDSIIIFNLTVAAPVTNLLGQTLCQGDSYTFNNQILNQAGTYYDTMQTTNGCDSIITLELFYTPRHADSIIAPGSCSAVNNTHYYICDGMAAFVPWFSDAEFTWYWTIGDTTFFDLDTLFISLQANPKANQIVNPDTDYTICLTARHCGATYCDTFAIHAEDIKSINAASALSIYPNPASGLLYIKTAGTQPHTTIIYDAEGRVLSSMPFKPKLDVSQLSSGMYLLEVQSLNGVSRQRFVVLK